MIKKIFMQRRAGVGDRLAAFVLGWIFAGWVALLPHGAFIALDIGYAAFIALAFAAVREHRQD